MNRLIHGALLLTISLSCASHAALSGSARQAQLKAIGATLAEVIKGDEALKACYAAAERGEEKSLLALTLVRDAYLAMEERGHVAKRIVDSKLDTASERQRAEAYNVAQLPRFHDAILGYRKATDYCSSKGKPRSSVK